MSDRELLELAARAAGMNVCPEACHDDDGLFIGTGAGDLWKWNPLADDGHAFSLASKLNLTVEFGNNCVLGSVEVDGEGTDPLAATRRAIVRAAAEIGEAMPTEPAERS